MSGKFYQQHKKLISVLLVVMFVAGGMLCVKNVDAATYNIFTENGNYYIRMGTAVSAGGTGAASPYLYTKKVITKEQYDALTNATEAQLEAAYKSAKDTGTSGAVSAAGDVKTTNAAVQNAANDTSGNTLGDIVGRMFAWILYGIALGIGYIFMLVTKVMLIVATFNNFLDQPAVQSGWTVTRDVCNNFFIVFIMIMAIGSILQLQNYAWKAMLPKIIFAAIMINFSMMFTGIFIDLSQVIMLTFAAPLATTNAYNIILGAFGLPGAYQFRDAMAAISGESATSAANVAGLSWWDIIAALLFAILVSIVATCVILAITIVLVYRIITLWFLVILSPLWMFGKAFSKVDAITSEWLKMLTNAFIVGPAMMFFIYLSFLTMANMSALGTDANVLNLDTAGASGSTSVVNTSGAAAGTSSTTANIIAISKMASMNGVINFMIVCGLLIGSLIMGQRFGGKGAAWASAGTGWAKKFSGLNLAQSLGKAGAKRAKEFAGDITGASVATGAVQKYFGNVAAGRARARAEKIETGAGNIAAGMERVKKKAASLPQQAFKKYRQKISGDDIDRAKAGIASDQADLSAKTDALKQKQDASDKARNKLKGLQDDKQSAEEELNRQREIAAKMGEYDHQRAGIVGGSFTMGAGADQIAYSRNANGTWKKTDASGRVLQNNIDADDLRENATGYKDDFSEKRIKAEKAFVAGKTDEAFFEEGQFRYERQANGSWRKVNKTTGRFMGDVAAANLRADAGRRAASIEQSDEITQAQAKVASLDTQISAQEITSRDADEAAVQAQQDVHAVEANIANKEEDIRRAQRRQAAWDKNIKAGLYGAGAVAGLATGGLAASGFGLIPAALAASAGAAAGSTVIGKGALELKNGIENAGKTDAKLASNLNSDGIKKASEGLKDMADGDILTRLDDPTLTKFDKIAMQLEAMNRELLSVEKAKAAKESILKETANYRGDNDKKVNAMLNSILEKKYRSLTSTFSDFAGSDAIKKSAAQKDIDEGIMSGHYRMDSLDSEALKLTVERFADKLNFNAFKSQLDKLNENEKELVKQSLIAKQASLSEKAKGNLARLTNVSTAFGTDTAATERFIGGLSAKDLKDILNGPNKEQARALTNAINKNLSILDERVQRQINNNTSDGKAIRVALGL